MSVIAAVDRSYGTEFAGPIPDPQLCFWGREGCA